MTSEMWHWDMLRLLQKKQKGKGNIRIGNYFLRLLGRKRMFWSRRTFGSNYINLISIQIWWKWMQMQYWLVNFHKRSVFNSPANFLQVNTDEENSYSFPFFSCPTIKITYFLILLNLLEVNTTQKFTFFLYITFYKTTVKLN